MQDNGETAIYIRTRTPPRTQDKRQSDGRKKVSSFASIFCYPSALSRRTYAPLPVEYVYAFCACGPVSPSPLEKDIKIVRTQKLHTSCCFTATELWMVAISQIKPYCPDMLMVGKGINLFHTDFISIPIIDHMYRVIKKRSDLQKSWILLPRRSNLDIEKYTHTTW